MLSLTILFTSLLASFAVAQNSSSSFDPNSVDLTTRSQWCQGERANCPYLCGGPANIKTNTCTASDLNFQCICANGTMPTNIADYLDTLPNHICNREFANCRQTNPGSQSCKTCGTLMPTDVKAVAASTAAPSSSSSPTSTGSATATSPTASKQSSAGNKIEGTVGGMAAGIIAAVLL